MRFAPTLAALALIATPALAQQGGGMQGMDHGSMQGMNHDDMSRMMAGNPYGQAEMDMHQKMMAAKQGDAAEMWTRKMIEHHRGAIAMSRVAVREASDAETKRMAQMTITKQEKDIAELQAWLRKHGKRPQ
ncbi:DUF305 domain-containing protein [Sphingomonas sp. MA1305]|jgi:uncharacterized protein (DUF305 family)|uniref:DUF305 domain-containing protein n=1 Tax=unclassified Sphingomonas TaxID=196159 RepID=UPI0008357E3A|nr:MULTISPECIES: DUF305 domain-containing protein [unclassified Sphingomonas]MBI0476957.1 DUF305 domain-containing protein [Sphingomonas sp. MA1305]MCP4025545.1 DUF305 domain-containing protein [Sphingomonas sp.]